MLNIKNLVITACLSLTIGFMVGSYSEKQFVKADKFEAATEAQSQTTTEIKESLETSLAVESEVAASNQKVSKIRSAVAAHLKEEVPHDQGKPSCAPADVLIDGRTVFLLNAARSGSGISTTGSTDGEVSTAPSVGFPELIDNDLQVVQMYRELATKHDALVDWVSAEVEQRNAK